MKIIISRSSIPSTVLVNGKHRPTTNADGDLIHPTLEGVLNFWKWFGNSRTTVGGHPQVFYHGTDAKFDVFKPSEGLRGNPLTGKIQRVKVGAFFFALREDEALSYGSTKNQVAHNVIPVYLKIDWLARVRAYSDIEEYTDDTEDTFEREERQFWQYVEDPAFIKRFTADWGEDWSGIAYDDRNAYEPEYVVYNPHQIKSIHNSGAFDIHKASIYE